MAAPVDVPVVAADLVARAILAPSSHNTQPWRFGVAGDVVRICADRTRGLPVNDPFDRELTMSCAAALFNLRVAAACAGRRPHVRLLPDPADPDLLAEVRLGDDVGREWDVSRLFAAMPARRTHRAAFAETPVDPATVEAMVAAARAEGAWLAVLDGDEREALAAMVDEGDRIQFSDPRWRRELAMWLHPRRSGDGLVMPAPVITRFAVSHLDMGAWTGSKDAKLALSSPVVAVLGTDSDSPVDWLAAGQALQRVLLTAACDRVQASFLNQPIQVAVLRPQLAREIGRAGRFPQVALRLGHPGEEPPPAPRRPLADVLQRA